MTVATAFHDFQNLGAPPDIDAFAKAGNASPNLRSIHDFCMWVWGGQNLGYAPYARPIRGGLKPSSHTWGALDWRYYNVTNGGRNPGRDVLLNDVLPFLINNSAELGIQAIHDYAGCRIWRANRSSDSAGGWRMQSIRNEMGASWALWIHVEVHPSAWFDSRPVAERVGLITPTDPTPPTPPAPPTPPPAPPVPPTPERPTVTAISLAKTTLDPAKRDQLRGNSDVALFQIYVNGLFGAGLAVDSDFGPQTQSWTRTAQAFAQVTQDGVIGPASWRAFLNEDGQ